jgi:threonine synthase
VLPFLYDIFSDSKHIYIEASNDEIQKAREIAEECGVRCENSAATAFAGLLGYQRPKIPQDAHIVIVSTGKGVEA